MKASDILICTDFDDTLYYGGIPKANIRAINDFMNKGGLFTLASGRSGRSVAKTPLPFTFNAPMVGVTGSEIYDLQNGIRLAGHFMEDGWQDILRDLVKGIPANQSFEIETEDERVCGEAKDIESMIAKIGKSRILKFIALTDYEGDELFPQEAVEICRGRCNLTSNGYATYETTRLGVDKGTGVLELKKITGAKVLVCIGDYLGDIPMIRAADIGYAVANAADAVKAAADRVTVHAKDGALAAIIKELTD